MSMIFHRANINSQGFELREYSADKAVVKPFVMRVTTYFCETKNYVSCVDFNVFFKGPV